MEQKRRDKGMKRLKCRKDGGQEGNEDGGERKVREDE
jgi:hypothetical protein